MEYELYHHGILGMKWGIRRYQNEDGSLTPEGRKRYKESSEDERRYTDLRRKTPEQMSNQELRTYNERARLKDEYSRLSTKKKTAIAMVLSGAALAATGVVAKRLMTKYLNKGADYVEDKIIDTASTVKDLFKRSNYTVDEIRSWMFD